MNTHGNSSAPPRVEVVSGLIRTRQHNFVPNRRFREDGREASRLAMGGGRQNKPLGAPAVAKQTKPGDPQQQVEVEPQWYLYPKENKTIQIM